MNSFARFLKGVGRFSKLFGQLWTVFERCLVSVWKIVGQLLEKVGRFLETNTSNVFVTPFPVIMTSSFAVVVFKAGLAAAASAALVEPT